MKKNVLELFWENDPNGLVVLDGDMVIVTANPAFEDLFQIPSGKSEGFDAKKIFNEELIGVFKDALNSKEPTVKERVVLESYAKVVRLIAFRIPEENLVAGIFVDITREEQRRKELAEIKIETLEKIRKVILKQMNIAQEIASLLGETTAETKASLLKLLEVIEGGNAVGLHNPDESG